MAMLVTHFIYKSDEAPLIKQTVDGLQKRFGEAAASLPVQIVMEKMPERRLFVTITPAEEFQKTSEYREIMSCFTRLEPIGIKTEEITPAAQAISEETKKYWETLSKF